MNGRFDVYLFVSCCFVFVREVLPKNDQTCWEEFSKQDANSFLSSGKRSTPKECCCEGPCEKRQEMCYTEQYRSYIRSTNPTFQCSNPTDVVKITSWCPGHYEYTCTDTCNALGRDRCDNGGTCVSNGHSWSCICRPGFTGTICQYEKCHPTPADVVFVLDSSISMLESQFHKQLGFVANFTDHINIGENDFQISVITYSSEAHIEFFLNTYTDNITLKEAVMNITYKPGATFTDKGLEAVKTVFSTGHGIKRSNAERFVYLLTDGLSNDRKKTKKAAQNLKDNYGVQITVVGIGNMVSHKELADIASRHNGLLNVFSVNNFNSLYLLLKQLVHFNCDECFHSSESDIALVIDTSYNVTHEQFNAAFKAVHHLVDLVELGVDKARLSVTTFDTMTSEMFGFGDYTDKDLIKSKVSEIIHSANGEKMDIVSVLDDVMVNTFLSNARLNATKFLILFSNGNFGQLDSIKLQHLKSMLKSNNIETVAIGSGNDVNINGLISLVDDKFHMFVTSTDETPNNFDVLQSEFVKEMCDLNYD